MLVTAAMVLGAPMAVTAFAVAGVSVKDAVNAPLEALGVAGDDPVSSATDQEGASAAGERAGEREPRTRSSRTRPGREAASRAGGAKRPDGRTEAPTRTAGGGTPPAPGQSQPSPAPGDPAPGAPSDPAPGGGDKPAPSPDSPLPGVRDTVDDTLDGVTDQVDDTLDGVKGIIGGG